MNTAFTFIILILITSVYTAAFAHTSAKLKIREYSEKTTHQDQARFIHACLTKYRYVKPSTLENSHLRLLRCQLAAKYSQFK